MQRSLGRFVQSQGWGGLRSWGLACSGGGDSTAMALLLDSWCRKNGGHIEILHVNYGTRGRDSMGDEEFVRDLARRLGVSCWVLRPRKGSRPGGANFQDWARQARYGLMARRAKSLGLDGLATAHTADDQAETFLDRLQRGAGPLGLRGILAESSWKGIRIVRPLLTQSRLDLRAFLRAKKQDYRQDKSNESPRYKRNRIRKLLEQADPRGRHGLNQRLAQTALLLGEALGPQEGQAPKELEVALLKAAPVGRRRNLVRQAALSAGVPPDRLGYEKVEAAVALALGGQGPLSSSLSLGKGWSFVKSKGRLSLSRRKAKG